MPTCPVCRSTASTTPATCSSGPRPARPRPGSPAGPWQAAPEPTRRVDREPHRGAGGSRRRARSRARARATWRRGRRQLGTLLRPGGRGGDGRGDQGGRQGGRFAGGGGRGPRLRGAGRPGQPRPVGPQARRQPGPGAHDIQAVKAVEIGDGWGTRAGAARPAHDAIHYDAAERLRAPDRPGRRHRGGISNGALRRGPGGHEAAGHPEPARAQDGRRRHQGVDAELQGAHRHHRRARHGRGGRDDDGAGAGRRGAAQVRRRLDAPRCVRNRDGYLASLRA